MTFDAVLEQPGATAAFGNPAVKIDGLIAGDPFIAKLPPNHDPYVSSEWFALPALAPAVVEQIEAMAGETTARTTADQTALLALHAAEKLGEADLGGYLNEGKVTCPTATVSKDEWVARQSALVVEKAKPKAQQRPQDLARLGAAGAFYKACLDFRQHTDRLSKVELQPGQRAAPFDITVTVKEFRERPFAKFFGAVLSSDTVASGVAAAVAAPFDPVKAEAEEKAEVLLREAYETAVVDAEKAIASHAGEVEPVAKLAKYIDMEAKKRAANRKARGLSLPVPYPDSGFWI
jgi:hypothetical protein